MVHTAHVSDRYAYIAPRSHDHMELYKLDYCGKIIIINPIL